MSETFQRLRAALADRYALDREIGTGGMATVYLAQDLRHRRQVALKVVRPDLGGAFALDRFLREIELAARLQHPHILPVFDSGVVEDSSRGPLPYFVMPFVEGESLRDRLRREGRLSPEQAAVLAGEVADALAYAHAHGVIHRDIKPENILLSGGHAVVADFGVAKAIESGVAADAQATSSGLTGVGFAVGTPQYMSPEQATGRDPVDARADQYSLGCVLYEMLAGEPPFTGESAQSIVAKAMTAPRPRPPALGDVVVRAMAADPRERYPDMTAFAAALREGTTVPARRAVRRWVPVAAALALAAALAGAWLTTRRESAAAAAPSGETIAVLPFSASGPGVEFLGEGMVDLLATNLNGVGGIRTVDPRTVVRRWGSARGAGVGAVDQGVAVGRDLQASSVVLGSAVSAGGRVRLAADVYTVAGEQVGRAQVDGPVDSVLPLVDRLSLALLRDVWRTREPLPTIQVAAVTTDSLEALRAYLRGEQLYRRLAFEPALAEFTRAVEVDSTFALAHFRRALMYGWTAGYGAPGSREAAAASFRYAHRLPPRDRRLLGHYLLFLQGKPSSVDSARAFVADYPADLEGRYLLGEALYHTRAFTGVSTDTIVAAFDSVVRRDSSLMPAAVHPVELGILYRDSAMFRRYWRVVAPTAPPERAAALRTVSQQVWGAAPPDSAVRAAMRVHFNWPIEAAYSTYYLERGGSDTVLGTFRVLARMGRVSREGRVQSLRGWGYALAGFGRMRESRAVADTLAAIAPREAAGVIGLPIMLGLARRSSTTPLDSIHAAMPEGFERTYVGAMRALVQGRYADSRRQIDAALASRDTTIWSGSRRGLLVATRGWGALLQGDSTDGIRGMREGLEMAAAPNAENETAFLRFQLALALAGREDTRKEGIGRLRNSFYLQGLFIPLSYLALGQAWEAAGEADSAAYAYGRFIQLWDKADPELQGRVAQAREALERITAEPRR